MKLRSRFGGLVTVIVAGALLLPPTASVTAVDSPPVEGPRPQKEYAVGRREVTLVDADRATDSNRSYTGAPDRTLPVLIMYPATGTPFGLSQPSAKPARRAGPFPLVVFSHGFRANAPAYGDVLLRRIAAQGYVVAAPTFPLSSAAAPGGPKLTDYVNQPADVSFVIDRVLAINRQPGPLHGLIRRKEIGAMGHSLGGITTLGVTYNSANADPRIKAAVPISGLQLPFPGGTWTWPRVPLLLIHGDDDGTVPYAGSTRAYAEAKAPKFLLTLLDGPHTPFGAPYLDQIVRSIDAFLDRYLRHQPRALARLEGTGTVPGVSTLQSDPRSQREPAAPDIDVRDARGWPRRRDEGDLMAGALDGVRILDLSWGIAGPLGVMLLAEQGADVIKVEPPGGDPFRSYSGYAVWNRSRRSVTVDLKRPTGREALLRLAEEADVLVETFRPGVTDRLGIGYDAVHQRNPRLVYCSCPGYPEGHRMASRPGYDALVQASSGQQWEQPGWRLGPIFLHMPMPSMGAMFLIPTGILAALLALEETGRGQHVTTSLFQGALLYTTQIWQHVEKAPAAFHDLMGKTYPPGIHQQMLFEVADSKWVHASVMSGLTPKASQDELLGLEDPPDPLTFLTMPPEERDKFTAGRRKAYLKHDRDELVRTFQENNHGVEAVITMEEALGEGGTPHPQLATNGMIANVDDPELGSTTQIGVPINLLGTPGAIQGPQPLPGEHNVEIFGLLGYSDQEIAALSGEVA